MKTPNRLKLLRIIVCAGLLVGICFSSELWFPLTRTFPRAPLIFDLPENSVVHIERLLTIILAVSLAATVFSPRRKISAIAALASLFLLILFDQTRLQPWVYQYFLLLTVMILCERAAASAAEKDVSEPTTLPIGLAQIIIAALYFWSGVQKLNFSFSHEVLPALISPAANLLPSFQFPFVRLGIVAALVEIFIGVGLLFRRTRNLAVCLAAAMHLMILFFLTAKGYNSIVWIWNAALIVLVFVAFWRSWISPGEVFREKRGWKAKAAKLITAASFLLPVLNFFGWWDSYLSGALYSGNTETAVIRINKDAAEKLSPAAREIVFQTQNGGEMMLPLFEWAMNDLNVPVYPERRVSRAIARKVCGVTEDKKRIELIVKERPAILDGSFKISRTDCAEIENIK